MSSSSNASEWTTASYKSCSLQNNCKSLAISIAVLRDLSLDRGWICSSSSSDNTASLCSEFSSSVALLGKSLVCVSYVARLWSTADRSWRSRPYISLEIKYNSCISTGCLGQSGTALDLTGKPVFLKHFVMVAASVDVWMCFHLLQLLLVKFELHSLDNPLIHWLQTGGGICILWYLTAQQTKPPGA